MSRKKTEKQHRRFETAIFFTFLSLLLIFNASNISANPKNGTIVRGSADIVSESAKKLTVNQSTGKAIINWRGFSIAADEHTQFIQPSTDSIALNRVTGNDPSSIFGQLTANGRLMLVNPNGVLFGPSSRIDVNSLLATTHDISDDDFWADRFNFNIPGNPSATVVNRGQITAAERGLVALVAPGVENSGIIFARLGRVALASTNAFTLDFYGDQLINFAVGSEVSEQIQNALVNNAGRISADGGSVWLAANAARDVVNKVINTSGIIEARSVESVNGEIVLRGGESGTVAVSGTLDASGKEPGQTGGTVQVLGEQVRLLDRAMVDVSGDAGGGAALIGGDSLGQGEIPQSSETFLDDDVIVDASAISNGNGGRIIVFASDIAEILGTLIACGGDKSGDGGLVETSGWKYLYVKKQPKATAPNGSSGEWVIDPHDLIVSSFTVNGSFSGINPIIFTPDPDAPPSHQYTQSGSDVDLTDPEKAVEKHGGYYNEETNSWYTESVHVDSATIEAALNSGTSVTIKTSSPASEFGNIFIGSSIQKTSVSDATLRFEADGGFFCVRLDSHLKIISNSGKLNLYIESGNDVTLAYNDATSTLNTNGGSLTINAGGDVSVGNVVTNGGEINIIGSISDEDVTSLKENSGASQIIINGETVYVNGRAIAIGTSQSGEGNFDSPESGTVIVESDSYNIEGSLPSFPEYTGGDLIQILNNTLSVTSPDGETLSFASQEEAYHYAAQYTIDHNSERVARPVSETHKYYWAAQANSSASSVVPAVDEETFAVKMPKIKRQISSENQEEIIEKGIKARSKIAKEKIIEKYRVFGSDEGDKELEKWLSSLTEEDLEAVESVRSKEKSYDRQLEIAKLSVQLEEQKKQEEYIKQFQQGQEALNELDTLFTEEQKSLINKKLGSVLSKQINTSIDKAVSKIDDKVVQWSVLTEIKKIRKTGQYAQKEGEEMIKNSMNALSHSANDAISTNPGDFSNDSQILNMVDFTLEATKLDVGDGLARMGKALQGKNSSAIPAEVIAQDAVVYELLKTGALTKDNVDNFSKQTIYSYEEKSFLFRKTNKIQKGISASERYGKIINAIKNGVDFRSMLK